MKAALSESKLLVYDSGELVKLSRELTVKSAQMIERCHHLNTQIVRRLSDSSELCRRRHQGPRRRSMRSPSDGENASAATRA